MELGEDDLVVYIGTAEKRKDNGKVYAFGCLFPSRPDLDYSRLIRFTGEDDTLQAQLCALAYALVKADQLNPKDEDGKVIEKKRVVKRVIVRTNARRFVSYIQFELTRQGTIGFEKLNGRNARVMEVIISYRNFFQHEVHLFFAPHSDLHVEAVAKLAVNAFMK